MLWLIYSLVLFCFFGHVDGRTVECGSFCPPTNSGCAGVVVRDVCRCNMCVENPKQKSEECGDQLGPQGVCDSRQGLICQYPLDDVYATGICVKGVNEIMVEPSSNLLSKLARFFG